jgi:hypothetical protein
MQDKFINVDTLNFLAELNRFAAGTLGGPHTGLSLQDQFLLAHRWRMLRFSQGIEVTLKGGLVDPAGALLRVLIELGYVIAAIADDPSKLIDLLQQGQAEGRKALEGLKKALAPGEREDFLTDDFLDAEIAALKSGTGFVAHNWAGMAKSMDSYATIYRLVSRHSHGGSKGTLDYFDGLDTESPSLRPNPSDELAHDYCVVAAALLIDALKALPLQTMTSDRTAQLSTMQIALDGLKERAYKR